MKRYSLKHLSGTSLRTALKSVAKHEHESAADVIAHFAEFDDRKLYLEDGYPSMIAYSVAELGYSEGESYRRMDAGRRALRFPVIFEMVADGRLHLTAVNLVGPRLTDENFRELLAEVANQSKAEIELLLARRFPKADLAPRVRAIPPPVQEGEVRGAELALARVQNEPPVLERSAGNQTPELALAPVQAEPAPVRPLAAPPDRSTVKPLAPQRFGVQLTIDQSTYDKLRKAQGLLSHQLRSNDLAGVLDRALDALIRELEKRRFGATDRPRASSNGPSEGTRHIPNEVKRAVRARDGGRCTFVSAGGRRCESRDYLEFDHIVPVARGGASTSSNLRLLCRAHNQHAARAVFGAGFMNERSSGTAQRQVEDFRPCAPPPSARPAPAPPS